MTMQVIVIHVRDASALTLRVQALVERLQRNGFGVSYELLGRPTPVQVAADVVLQVPDSTSDESPIAVDFADSADRTPKPSTGVARFRLALVDRDDDLGYLQLMGELLARSQPVKQAGTRDMGRQLGHINVYNERAHIGQQIVAEVVNLGSINLAMPSSAPSPSPPSPPPASTQTSVVEPFTIALFSANSTLDGHHLQLEEEMAGIEEALQMAPLRDHYALRLCPAATLERFVAKLDEIKPAVVHFCGHTDRRGRITLRDGDGEYHLEPDDLAKLLAMLRRPPRLVVLASCNSYAPAKAATKAVEHAIGFEGEVYDQTASTFSRLFYGRLAAGRELDVVHAFRLAKLTLEMSGYTDGDKVRLLPEERRLT